MENKVENFIKNVLLDIGIEEDLIRGNAYIRSEIGLDSTEVVELALALKKEYGVDVSLKQDMRLEELYFILSSKRNIGGQIL